MCTMNASIIYDEYLLLKHHIYRFPLSSLFPTTILLSRSLRDEQNDDGQVMHSTLSLISIFSPLMIMLLWGEGNPRIESEGKVKSELGKQKSISTWMREPERLRVSQRGCNVCF